MGCHKHRKAESKKAQIEKAETEVVKQRAARLGKPLAINSDKPRRGADIEEIAATVFGLIEVLLESAATGNPKAIELQNEIASKARTCLPARLRVPDTLLLIESLSVVAEEGDTQAAKDLVTIATSATEKVNALLRLRFEMMRDISSRFSVWPLLGGPYNQLDESNAALVRSLRIGEKQTGDFDMKRLLRTSTTAREWAFKSITYISINRELYKPLKPGTPDPFIGSDGSPNLAWAVLTRRADGIFSPKLKLLQGEFYDHCGKLPPLTTATVPAWFKLGRELIMHICDGHPDEHPDLKWLGEHRVRNKAISERAKPARRRDGIFKQIKKAYYALARD